MKKNLMTISNRLVDSLALDIGNTKIEICLFTADFQILQAESFATRTLHCGQLRFLEDLKALIRKHKEPSMRRLGVSFNCAVHEGVITASSLLGSFHLNLPFQEELKREFGVEVRLENDAHAHALAESYFGEGEDVKSFVLVNIGTGIRLALVTEGKLQRGFNGNFGEISRFPVYISQLGQEQKLRDVLSGGGIEELYTNLAGSKKTAPEIFLSQEKDSPARQVIEIFTTQLAKFLAVVSFFYNPERIVLTGGVTASASLFLPQTLKYYRENISDFQQAEVVVSRLKHGACLGVVI